MKKFIFLLLTAMITPHSTNYAQKWNNEKRNLCIGLAAVATIGYLGYRYYSSDNTNPTESEINEQNNEQSIIIKPTNPALQVTEDLKKLEIPEHKDDTAKLILEDVIPSASYHSDLAKKVHCGLEALYSNLHKADIEAIFARNIRILEG
jgi:hypothetical protein